MTTIQDSLGRDIVVEAGAASWRYSCAGMEVILSARDDAKAIAMFDTHQP